MAPHPEADIRVFAIWFNMVSSDHRSAWPSELLTDPRVSHYWDEAHVVGKEYSKHVTQGRMGDIEWDAYFLYGPEVRWDRTPPDHIASGAPIIRQPKALQKGLERHVFN